MATWHQSKSKTSLYHKTLWTVLVDPPNELRCTYLCGSEWEARELVKVLEARGRTSVLVLKPANLILKEGK